LWKNAQESVISPEKRGKKCEIFLKNAGKMLENRENRCNTVAILGKAVKSR